MYNIVDVTKETFILGKNVFRHFSRKVFYKRIPFYEKVSQLEKNGSNNEIILTIKGVYGSFYGVDNLEEYFRKKGKEVIPLFYKSNDILKASSELFELIQYIYERLDKPSLYVVAHSKGGLIIAEVMRRYPLKSYVKKSVILGSPLNNLNPSILTQLNIIDSNLVEWSQEMNEFLKGGKEDYFRDIIVVAGGKDFIVPPNASAVENIKHTIFEELGHVGLVEDRRVFGFIYDNFFNNYS